MPHTLLALDFDDTLVVTSPTVLPVWHHFMAEWLVTHQRAPSYAAAVAQIESLRPLGNPYGCGPTYFAKLFGYNKAWIDAYYQAVSPHLLAVALPALQRNQTLINQLTALAQKGTQLAIISQSHRDFILPLLQHLGLTELFPPLWVIDRAHKRLEPHSYQLIKHLAQPMQIKQFIIVDDNPTNFPHAVAEGFQTVHIASPLVTDSPSATTPTFPTLSAYLSTLLA